MVDLPWLLSACPDLRRVTHRILLVHGDGRSGTGPSATASLQREDEGLGAWRTGGGAARTLGVHWVLAGTPCALGTSNLEQQRQFMGPADVLPGQAVSFNLCSAMWLPACMCDLCDSALLLLLRLTALTKVRGMCEAWVGLGTCSEWPWAICDPARLALSGLMPASRMGRPACWPAEALPAQGTSLGHAPHKSLHHPGKHKHNA
jgi:hypothetical protein